MKLVKLLTLLIALGLAMAPAAHAAAQGKNKPKAEEAPPRIVKLSPGRAGRIDGIARSLMRSQRIRGLSVGVAVNGKIVYARGYGHDRGKRAATKDSIYAVGHITQEFTAGALLLWQQRRYRNAPRVTVNDPLTEYFFGVAHWGGAKLSNLLTHTSGMPELTDSIFFEERLYSRIKTQRILNFIKGRDLAFKPGTAFRYSHSNYFLVAQVIEIGLEVYYYDFIQTDIYNQLKMKRSSFLSRQPLRQRAQGYKGAKPARDVNPAMFFGSADATSTVIDLIKWDRGILRGNMFTKLSRDTFFGRFVQVKPMRAWYGAGFFVRPGGAWNEYFTVGHIPGFSGINMILKRPKGKDDVYVVILANQTKVKGLDRAAHAIAAAAR
jgi:CubicO group peptidase (beta-lactamase class C family)